MRRQGRARAPNAAPPLVSTHIRARLAPLRRGREREGGACPPVVLCHFSGHVPLSPRAAVITIGTSLFFVRIVTALIPAFQRTMREVLAISISRAIALSLPLSLPRRSARGQSVERCGRRRRGIRRPNPALSAHDMSRAGTTHGIIVRSISMELPPPMRTTGMRPARALCAGAARGRYDAARLSLSPQQSLCHTTRGFTANGSVWIAVSTDLISRQQGVVPVGAHFAPVLRTGAIMSEGVTTCCRAVCAIPPEVLQQTGASGSQYLRTSFSGSRVLWWAAEVMRGREGRAGASLLECDVVYEGYFFPLLIGFGS